MPETVTRNYLQLSIFTLILIGAFITLHLLRTDDNNLYPKAKIIFSGPTKIPVTPDCSFSDPLNANSPRFVSFSISVQVKQAIKPKGKIRIEQGYLFNGKALIGSDVRYCFPDPEVKIRNAANALRVETEGARHLVKSSPCSKARRTVEVHFPDGLPANEKVTFHFGDRTGGGPGLCTPGWPLKVRFFTFVDMRGDGACLIVDGDHPEVEIYAAEADRLRILAPSMTTRPEISVKIIPVRGAAGKSTSSLPVQDFIGKVDLYVSQSDKKHLATLNFKEGERFKESRIKLPGPGLYRLIAESGNLVVKGISNPVLFPDPKKISDPASLTSMLKGDMVYWGSLQNHTALGGHGASTPDEAYRCASEEGGLDFCAITDHSSNPSFHWEDVRKVPDKFNKPSRFVAFAGYEWTSNKYGHRHIILKDCKKGSACTEMRTNDPFEIYTPDLSSLSLHVGHDPNVLIIAHHSRRILDPPYPRFDFGDPEYLPRQMLFEIFSWQGGQEGAMEDLPINGRIDRTLRSGSGFRDALKMDYRFGVTGDSDQHMGTPGIPICIKRTNGIRYGYSGQTAVFSDSLDRDGIFSSLEKRRCYGTTGARMLVLFSAGAGFMGEEVSCADEMFKIRVFAACSAPISKLEIIADGEDVIYNETPSKRQTEISFSMSIKNHAKGKWRSFYLRIKQEDDHLAWTSPVWIKSKIAANQKK